MSVLRSILLPAWCYRSLPIDLFDNDFIEIWSLTVVLLHLKSSFESVKIVLCTFGRHTSNVQMVKCCHYDSYFWFKITPHSSADVRLSNLCDFVTWAIWSWAIITAATGMIDLVALSLICVCNWFWFLSFLLHVTLMPGVVSIFLYCPLHSWGQCREMKFSS